MLLVILFFSCTNVNGSFNRCSFEDNWWQLSTKELCFNFNGHSEDERSEENQLLIYEDDHLSTWGVWQFSGQNEYTVGDKSVYVIEDNECWDIEYSKVSVTACECLLDVSNFPDGDD